MEVSPVNNGAPASGSTAANPNAAVISSDFETFLRMLTAQLENQDPLNPVDSNDYAVQLATFSSVEQQVLTNDLLTQLTTQMGGTTLSDFAEWVGMEVRSTAPAYFSGEPITVATGPMGEATRAELVVYDQSRQEVARQSIDLGADSISWAGLDGNGTSFPQGRYSFEIARYSEGALIDSRPAQSYSRVTEIQADPAGTVVVLDGGAQVRADAVTAVREAV